MIAILRTYARFFDSKIPHITSIEVRVLGLLVYRRADWEV